MYNVYLPKTHMYNILKILYLIIFLKYKFIDYFIRKTQLSIKKQSTF